MLRLLPCACIALVACGRLGFRADPTDAMPGGDGRRGLDAGPEPCPTFASFCDGFESGNYGKWSGTVMTAALTVESSIVHTGDYALEANVPVESGNGAEGAVYLTIGTHDSGMLAVREWVYAPQQINNYVGTLYFTSSTGSQYSEILGDDVAQWSVTESSTAGGLDDHTGSVLTQAGVWMCVEADLTLGAGGKAELYIADVLVVDTTYDDPDPNYDTFAVGATRTNAAGFEVIIDDVAVAAQHIGC
jgi:hypothetical protein